MRKMGQRTYTEQDYLVDMFGKRTYDVAMKALSAISGEIENPSYTQILKVIECMRECAARACLLTGRK